MELTRQALKHLGLTTADLEKLGGVKRRAVDMWISGEREVPDAISSYLRLFAELPKAAQARELARIRGEEDPSVYEGAYAIHFKGSHGIGVGVIVLMNGRVFGADSGGITYDGTYIPSTEHKNSVEVTLKVTVPAKAVLVTGKKPQPVTYSFPLTVSVPVRGKVSLLTLETDYGQVELEFAYLRPIPR